MAADNKQIATDVLGAVGGKDNVIGVTHCFTRLRFNLKDEGIVDDDTVKNVNGVLGVQKTGGQYQVIVGTNVPDVYDELCKVGGFEAQPAVDEKVDGDTPKEKLTVKSALNACLNYLSGSVVPLIPILIAGALFRTLSAIFGPTLLGVFPEDNAFIVLCNNVFNAAFYFMPIVAGYSAAKYLKINPIMGAFMGAILVEPNFLALATTEGASFSVYGIPAPTLNYANTLIPILLSVAVMAPIHKFVEKHLPNAVRATFSVFVTLLIMLPLSLCLLAPLGNYVGAGLAGFFEILGNSPFGFLGTMLVGATWPLLVLTGMHVGIAAIALAQFAQTGVDSMILMAVTAQAYTATAVAVVAAIRFKNPELRSLHIGYLITNFFGGVGEPLLYGVFIKYKRPWIATIIGGAAAGLYASIMHVVIYSPIQGFFQVLSFAGGSQANFINGVIAEIVGFVVSFIVCWFFGFTKEQLNEGYNEASIEA